MGNLSDILKRASKEYDPAVFVGLIVAVVVFAIEVRLCVKGILFGGDDRKLASAKSKGHIIKGKMIQYRYEDIDNAKGIRHIADYEYVVEGVAKRKRVITTGPKPPYELSLYYVDSPKKIFSEYDLKGNPLQILMCIIPLAIAILVMKIMN